MRPSAVRGALATQGPSSPMPEPLLPNDPIGPLLSRANLARVRGQWDEGIALCQAALELAPTSVEALSLLGELSAAQGKNDEALHYFSLAVDLKPDNTLMRERRDKLLQAKHARLVANQKQADPIPVTAPTKPKAPKARPRGVVIALIALGGLVMLVLGVWLGTYLANRNNQIVPSKEPGTVGRH